MKICLIVYPSLEPSPYSFFFKEWFCIFDISYEFLLDECADLMYTFFENDIFLQETQIEEFEFYQKFNG